MGEGKGTSLSGVREKESKSGWWNREGKSSQSDPVQIHLIKRMILLLLSVHKLLCKNPLVSCSFLWIMMRQDALWNVLWLLMKRRATKEVKKDMIELMAKRFAFSAPRYAIAMFLTGTYSFHLHLIPVLWTGEREFNPSSRSFFFSLFDHNARCFLCLLVSYRVMDLTVQSNF